MIISIEVGRAAGVAADPGRIAAQVVTGVGFLGAGAIIRSRLHISGLTTAATIWVLSALGLAIGAGYIMLAIAGAFLITVTLIFISYLEDAINRRWSTHTIRLGLDTREGIVGSVLEVFSDLDIPSEALEVNRSGEQWDAIFEYTSSQKKHRELIEKLSGLDGVRGVTET
jgi:putative Mg2+ transporter-C (MgtC) family protein